MTGENDFSRLELDLQGCLSNYAYFRGLLKPQTKLLVLVKANAYGPHTISYAWPNGRALLEKQVMEVLGKEPEDHIDFSCWNGEA